MSAATIARPTSLTRAVQLLWLLTALAVVSTVLAIIFDDELVAAWAGGEMSVDDTRVPPSFTPVVVTLVATLIVTAGLLMVFTLGGYNWARHSLAVMIVLIVIAAGSGVRVAPPVAFVVCALASIVVCLGLLWALWHRDTSSYLRTVHRNAVPDEADAAALGADPGPGATPRD